MKKVILNSTALLLAVSLMFTSCTKEDEKPNTTTESEVAVEDNDMSMSESDDIVAISGKDMEENDKDMGGRIAATYTNAHGATVTFTPKGSNATGNIVIDFGSTGVKSPADSKTRKGKINIVFTGKYRVPNTTQTITLDNYYVNANKVEGTKVLTHKFENNILSTMIKVTGGKITLTDNKTIEWSSDRVHTWDFKGTLPFEDDEVTVTGTAAGKSRDGINFDANIDINKPLLWKLSCLQTSKWIPVSGLLKVTPKDAQVRSVDYGSGACDRDITVSMGTFNKTITLNK